MIRYPDAPGTLLESDAFRRLLGWSAAAHLLVLVVSAFSPALYRPALAPAPIYVDLVTAPARATRSRQVVKEPVVIPKKPRAAAEPKPEAKPEPAPPETEPARPLTPEQILAQLRKEQGESSEIERAEAGAGQIQGRLDPERAAYRRRLENLIYGNWAGARGFRDQIGLEVLLEIKVDSNGTLRSVEVVRSSGNRHLDESAERAIKKSAPFPPPPRSVRVITVRMNPRDNA